VKRSEAQALWDSLIAATEAPADATSDEILVAANANMTVAQLREVGGVPKESK
jgi:hypothetical protein